MIVYNVGRRFFAMKADASHYRRTAKRTAAIHKVEISDRGQLAAFLDALCSESTGSAAQGVEPMSIAEEAMDIIPTFMRRDWERRAQNRAAGSA